MMRGRAPCLMLLCALAASPAWAENPKLDLRLEQVNFTEALAALTKATGISMRVYQPRLPPNFPARPGDARQSEKASFNWEGATLAKAMRDLSERYQVRPMRRTGSYEFYPGEVRKLPEKLTGLVEQDGFRLFARSLMIHQQQNRGLNFLGENPNFGENESLSLTLEGVLAERDPASLAAVENVIAVDDLGNRLEWRRNNGYSLSGESAAFPDEWSHTINFKSPDPRAKKIVSLQGDLMIYKWVRSRRVEVPLPLPEKVVKREAGDVTAIFSAYRVLAPIGPEDDQVEIPGIQPNLNFRTRPPVQGPVIRMRVVTSNAQPNFYSFRDMPIAIGESGRQYGGATLGGSSSFGSGNVRVSDAVYYFPDLEEPAVRLVWETTERGEVVRWSSFRMTDIPLPTGAPARPVEPGGVRPIQPVPPPAADHPWTFPGGATLLAKVEVLGKPVSGGTLELGMARVMTGKAGPVRWAEVPVDSQGGVRLINVQPGTYQVQLKFRANSPLKSGTGRWQNAAATVTLKPGQPASLPPLRWVAGAVNK